MSRIVRGLFRYRGWLADRSVVIAGMGRCGTTLLYDALRRRGFRGSRFVPSQQEVQRFRTGHVYKTHDFPPPSLPDYVRLIFLFGNPMDIVISTHRKINEWGALHHRHLRSALFQPNDSVFQHDTLRLHEHFEQWYRRQPFPFLSLRYESLFDAPTRDALEHYLGFHVPLPQFRKRDADWSNHPQRDRLWRLYGDLYEAVNRVEDVRLWRPLRGSSAERAVGAAATGRRTIQ